MGAPDTYVDAARPLPEVVERARRLGIRHVVAVTWRDLDAPDAGGSEVHLAEVTRRWADAGLDVSVRAAAVPDGPRSVTRNGVEVHRRGGRVGVFPGAALDTLRGRLGPADGVVDVFHGMPFLVPLWTRRPRVAVAHHCHIGTWRDLAPPGLAQIGHLTERFGVRAVYRRTPIVTLSPSSAAEITEHMGVAADRLRIGPVGVDDNYDVDPGVPRSERPLVVAGGRFMPPKGLDLLPGLLAAVRERVPDLEAVVFGDGPGRAAVAAEVAERGAGGWLRLAGFVDRDEQIDLYRRAWLLAAPSRREGWNMTITEAAACGTPAVVTRIPGHVDAVVDGETGRLADIGALAPTIAEVLSDEGQRRRLAAGAVARARRFRWEHTAAVILDALCDDAERRGR